MVSRDRARLEAQKPVLLAALNEHRITTISELRRVERVFATLGSPDVTGPMTAAWVHYVNSNRLLTELRSMTRNYPFSSACLDEAKRLVHEDPSSNRSWNYCWLILTKIEDSNLLPTLAHEQAIEPEMWGDQAPSAAAIAQLQTALENEWSTAVSQMLRYWETAPVSTASGGA